MEFVGAKQRTLFSALALRAPEPVPVDDLIEALWGGDPPGGAIQALQKQISRLRERLGDDAPLSHRPAGYALEIERAAIDAQRFEDLLRRARAALAGGAPDEARTDLAGALALWRGPALAEHRFDGFAQLEISRLEELRLEAIEEQMAAELACGRDVDLAGEPEALVSEHLPRERLRAQSMLALEILAGVARHRAMVALAYGDVGAAVALARQGVALRPPGSPEAGTDAYFLAICLFFTAMRGEAETLLRRYLETTPPGEQDVRRVFAMGLLAQAHAERGELDAADALIAESLATGSARGLDEHPPTQQAHLAAGIVALGRGDAGAAETHLEHAAALARRGGDRVEIASALLWLGRGRAAAGDRDGAADALHGADARLAGARVPALRPGARGARGRGGGGAAARRGRRGRPHARGARGARAAGRRPALRRHRRAPRPNDVRGARRRPPDPPPPRRGDPRRGGHPGPPARAALSARTAAGGAVRAASTARGARAGARPDRAARRTRAARATAAS